MNSLNPNQRSAVLHGEGPLLVLAGAGSGKTSTMAYRIAHLVASQKARPSEILGLSFTNKAAKELKERVHRLIACKEARGPGRESSKGLLVTTFHSLGVRLLRAHADRLGFQQNFTIFDSSDQRDVLRQVLRQIKIDERKFDPDVLLFEIGQAKNRFLAGAEAEAYLLESRRLGTDYAIAASSSYGKYQSQLRALNAMDFDDLLFNSVRLLEQCADVRMQYNEKFRYILVDEYQDTNPTQFRLLSLLTEKTQNLCVVGDDDQSIYAWRGADPSHILGFARQFPTAKTIILDQNYRSTSTILDAANGVISGNRDRHPKKLWSTKGTGEPLTQIVLEDDRDEAEFVADELLRLGSFGAGRPWRDFALLYRSNAQSRVFEEALRRNRIPYKIVGGMSFLDRKEVKDLMSYWRLAVNPRDDASLRRIANWPSRGLGRTSLEALGTAAFEKQEPIYEVLSQVAEFAPRAVAGAKALRQVIYELHSSLARTPAVATEISQWGKRSLELIGARLALDEENDDPVQAARKWENIEELVHSLGQFVPDGEVADGTSFLRDYLQRMALEARDDEEDRKKDANQPRDEVTLLTLHGAKGLEFPVVFLVGVEEGFLPHHRTIKEGLDFSEERRLCYVGITRAKDELFLTRAKNRIRFGKPVPRYPSRFIAEIPAALIVTRDASRSPDLSTKEAQDAHETKVKDFLSNIRANLTAGKTKTL